MAENVTATQHNIYTLRGTLVRDPLGWSKYIGEALYPFGLEAEVMFASHHWPRWGNARIQEVLRAQRVVLPRYHGSPQHNSRGVIQPQSWSTSTPASRSSSSRQGGGGQHRGRSRSSRNRCSG
jgi:hypothetical protein